MDDSISSSVQAAAVPVVGGRVFWVHRGADGVPDSAAINDLFEALEADFDSAGSGPIGLCVAVRRTSEAASRNEAVWPETELMFAGYEPDGTQLRIRYFEDARIGPGLANSPTLEETRHTSYPLEDRYRLLPFAESEEVSPEDVLGLWQREGAVPEAEAQRRVHEVHLVAVDRDDGVVGVSSAYLQRNQQLRMDMLYYRAFVARAHRKSSLAGLLATRGREVLDDLVVAGKENRAAGIVYEVENTGLKSYFNRALWLPTGFSFIGENQRGDHVRVRYFPGATISPPA